MLSSTKKKEKDLKLSTIAACLFFLFFKIPWIKLLPAVQIRKHQGLIKWDSTKKFL